MGWRDSLAEFIAPSRSKASLGTTQNPSQGLIDILGGGEGGRGVTETSAMRVSAVYACVRVISEDVAKLPIMVWRSTKDGGREEAKDHPLHKILRRPNRHMTIVSLLMAMASSYAFRGNALAVILRDERGVPTGLWPVSPGQVTLYEAEDGSLFYAVSRRTVLEGAMLRDKPMMIPDYDIFHVRGLTFDGVIGLSTFAQMRSAIGISSAGEKMTGSLMENGAQPGGLLKHPEKISAEAAQRLKDSWDKRHTGPGKAGKTVVLEEGMEWQQLGMTNIDAQFIEQRKFSIEEIARAFRVPLHMIGMLDRMTNNNVEALSKSYYDQSLMSVLEAFEAEAARAFELPDGTYVEFDVKRLLRADFKARQEGNRVQFSAGALSPNEWRRDEGRNPTKGGDVFARPLNTAFVDKDGNHVMTTPAGGSDPVVDDENGKGDQT